MAISGTLLKQIIKEEISKALKETSREQKAMAAAKRYTQGDPDALKKGKSLVKHAEASHDLLDYQHDIIKKILVKAGVDEDTADEAAEDLILHWGEGYKLVRKEKEEREGLSDSLKENIYGQTNVNKIAGIISAHIDDGKKHSLESIKRIVRGQVGDEKISDEMIEKAIKREMREGLKEEDGKYFYPRSEIKKK